jgi:hypothetical protein
MHGCHVKCDGSMYLTRRPTTQLARAVDIGHEYQIIVILDIEGPGGELCSFGSPARSEERKTSKFSLCCVDRGGETHN